VKTTKYEDICSGQGATFIPAVIETPGAFGKEWKRNFDKFFSFTDFL
jgi:hypothetical protein